MCVRVCVCTSVGMYMCLISPSIYVPWQSEGQRSDCSQIFGDAPDMEGKRATPRDVMAAFN